MQLSEAELSSMTADMADAHRDSLPALRMSLTRGARRRRSTSHRSVSRGVVFSLEVVCSLREGFSSRRAAPRPRRSHVSCREPRVHSFAARAAPPLDVQVAALAASLENLAVATYSAALSAATAGKLGTVPKVVATFVETAMGQHKDHAAAWNAMVAAAGYDRITAPNADIGKSVNAAFAKVTNVPGVAKLALTLEEAAAATYLEAVGVVSGKQAIETAATIQPVEMQHAAILNFVLGQYPVPLAFATTTGAATLAMAPAVHKS